MIDNDELPNYGRISGTLRLPRARAMQTQAGVAETLKLPPEKPRATDLLPPTDRV